MEKFDGEVTSIDDRHGDERLSDNSQSRDYEQCKTCKFRDKIAYDRSVCYIYDTVYDFEKPFEIAKNEEECEDYIEGEPIGWCFRDNPKNLSD